MARPVPTPDRSRRRPHAVPARFARGRRGTSIIEYAVLLASIAVALILPLILFGNAIRDIFTDLFPPFTPEEEPPFHEAPTIAFTDSSKAQTKLTIVAEFLEGPGIPAISEGATTGLIDLTIDDAETPHEALTVEAEMAPGILEDRTNALLTGTGAQRQVEFTLDDGNPVDAVLPVIMKVTDTGTPPKSGFLAFDLRIVPFSVNRQPVAVLTEPGRGPSPFDLTNIGSDIVQPQNIFTEPDGLPSVFDLTNIGSDITQPAAILVELGQIEPDFGLDQVTSAITQPSQTLTEPGRVPSPFDLTNIASLTRQPNPTLLEPGGAPSPFDLTNIVSSFDQPAAIFTEPDEDEGT